MSNELLPAPGVFRREEDPEETREKPWSYKSTHRDGRTSLRNHEMHIPTGDAPRDLAVRQHEMLHAAWSPIPDEQPDVALLAAEDARIETLATRAGIHREEAVSPDEVKDAIERFIFAEEDRMLASYAVASIGSPSEETVREALAGYDTETAPEAVIRLMDRVKELYARDSSPAAAQAAAELIRSHASEGEDDERYRLPSHNHRKAPEDTTRGKGKGGGRGKINLLDLPKYDFSFDFGKIDLPPLMGDESPWGIPKIDTPPLTRRLVDEAVVKGRKPRWRDTGAVPGAMHRLTTDSKVFRDRRRARGGTVLIDMSGSMQISPEEIDEFILSVPAGIVAGYWGKNDGGYGKPSSGTVRIFAADGRAVESRHFATDGGTNEVDLPAIEWLGKQSGPRFWVCDGGITVTGDHSPSKEQREYFWERIKTLGINWVEYNNEGGWPEKVGKAMRKYR